MVCIRSNTGSIVFLNLGFLAIAIPIGIPITKQRNIPISTMQVVIMALSQYLGLRKPMKNVQNPTVIVVLIFFPLTK